MIEDAKFGGITIKASEDTNHLYGDIDGIRFVWAIGNEVSAGNDNPSEPIGWYRPDGWEN